jgi:DNA modification methylase
MRELDSGDIDTITVSGRTDPELKALRIALNRLPAEAAWDNQTLRAEFEELVSLSFDLELTGFETAEIDQVLDLDLPQANVVEDEATIPPVEATAVSRPGDIWRCADHRLGCGNAHDRDFVVRVSEGLLADVAFTDPPYNVPIAGFVSGKGRSQHREFVQGTGEMTAEQFTEFLATALKVLKACCTPRALIFACIDWRHVHELLSAGRGCALELYNICVWAKTNARMGSLYNYRGFNAFGGERDDLLSMHPTVKPVALIADVLRDVTKRNGIVLDTFMGSGSTLIAAEETGRRCFGTELDPLYVDVAVRRWQAHSKRDAVHAESGELFCERAQQVPPETRHGE